ncbi:MAG: DUF4159 domain-containing protein [bacterium]|nr:DUF4159 domain-containing protein [bacterium]
MKALGGQRVGWAALAGALLLLAVLPAGGAGPLFTIARLKYDGGGDWYANPTSLPNLLRFAAEATGVPMAEKEAVVSLDDPELFRHTYLYMTGHGRVSFSPAQAERLRSWLLGGGFLHADDNYGLDEHFRREIKRVLPEYELVELPFEHPVYHAWFSFPEGLPKIHEHDGHPPRGYGIFLEGRLAVFYDWECDLGDGWEDAEVHQDPPALRRRALEMGTNLIVHVLGGGPDRLREEQGRLDAEARRAGPARAGSGAHRQDEVHAAGSAAARRAARP